MLDIKAAEPKSTKISIYVSDLGAYNAGTLTGEWTTLPVENVKEIYKRDVERFGDVDGYSGEEYFITDYEAPFKIDEYEDIDQLNRLAAALKDNELENIEEVYNSLDDPEDITEQPIEFDEAGFDELTAGFTKEEAARAVYFGNIQNWTDDYLRLDGYGNLESLSRTDWIDELNRLSDEIIEQFAVENNIRGL